MLMLYGRKGNAFCMNSLMVLQDQLVDDNLGMVIFILHIYCRMYFLT